MTSEKIKICGVTNKSEIKLLDTCNISYAWLWHGIPNGTHNLSLRKLLSLSSTPTKTLKFILVTIQEDIEYLEKIVERKSIYGIQMHGFQTPSSIKKIKLKFGNKIKIFKVLHIKNEKCLEENMIGRYIDAGTDAFILDNYKDKKNIGSTGTTIGENYISSFLSKWGDNKTMVAGGISDKNLEKILGKFTLYGIDIDSSSRKNGKIEESRIKRITEKLNFIRSN